MVVTILTQLKQQVGWPYQRLCGSIGLSYGNFRRWKHRLTCGPPSFSKPGPKKVIPLNPDELRGQVCRLEHGRQRSRGVGPLYRQYHSQISRRDLAVLAATVRRELLQRHQAELRHLTWHVPGSVWSFDDAELARFEDHPLHLHQVQDLASRYKFTPLVGEKVLGETVALHLEQHAAMETIPILGAEVYYEKDFLSPQEATTMFDVLRTKCVWERRRTSFKYVVPRDEAYYGEDRKSVV